MAKSSPNEERINVITIKRIQNLKNMDLITEKKSDFLIPHCNLRMYVYIYIYETDSFITKMTNWG